MLVFCYVTGNPTTVTPVSGVAPKCIMCRVGMFEVQQLFRWGRKHLGFGAVSVGLGAYTKKNTWSRRENTSLAAWLPHGVTTSGASAAQKTNAAVELR